MAQQAQSKFRVQHFDRKRAAQTKRQDLARQQQRCMREWTDGYRILVVEFDPADAVIPTATDGKFRVRRCRVVGEKDLVEIGLVSSAKEAS